MLVAMGWVGRHGHHPAAFDDLVARHIRHDQMIVNSREVGTARIWSGPDQTSSAARNLVEED